MTLREVFASALLAMTFVAGQDLVRSETDIATAVPAQSGDAYLVRSVRAVGTRIAAIVRLERAPTVSGIRSDEAAREAETQSRAQLLLPPTRADARGRAWRDLGFGSGTEPRDLVLAIVRDLSGMAFDPPRERLLVDPQRLLPDAGRGDPDEDPGASILLATGVAPDEPLAGHYLAHAFLDGPGLEVPVTTDAILGRQSLAEGAANLAALVLLFEGVGLESDVLSGSLSPEEVLGGQLVPGSMRSASPVVAHLLEFVYLDGFAQAANLARKGGFSRLAQERKTRRTTRDVLHLDRPPAPPVAIPEPTLPASLALSPLDQDSLGEQGIVSLVSLLTGKDNLGLITGDGWVADALWRFEAAPGSATIAGEGATIWLTLWKSDEDANDFVYGLERCLQSRFPGERFVPDPPPGLQVLRRPDRVYRIERSGLEVAFKVLTSAIDKKMIEHPKKKGLDPRPTTAPK